MEGSGSVAPSAAQLHLNHLRKHSIEATADIFVLRASFFILDIRHGIVLPAPRSAERFLNGGR
jgi:hypothetical protein